MLKFDSEKMIRELEEIYGVDDTPMDYEDFEDYIEEEHERMTERDLRGGL